MIDIETDPGIFRCRDEFLARAVERLGTYPSDFLSMIARIRKPEKGVAPRQAAGVLLPLLFRPSSYDDRPEKQLVFRLIKRSSRVSQPGDLSCPGGMTHPLIDRVLRHLLNRVPNPIIRGPARDYVARREPALRRIMTLFLANALRESWEEIGLSPLRVRFLGPLPAYSLLRFRRTIFPLAGFVENPSTLPPNREVEKIIEIPLASFYDKRSIGCYILSAPDATDRGALQSIRHPCLIHHDSNGEEQILWGATFHICVRFLDIVLDYRLPEWEKGRPVHRTLDPGYLAEK